MSLNPCTCLSKILTNNTQLLLPNKYFGLLNELIIKAKRAFQNVQIMCCHRQRTRQQTNIGNDEPMVKTKKKCNIREMSFYNFNIV